MTEGVIYRYKSPSGKYYIGQTIDEERRRKKFLYNKIYAGPKINRARQKYGPENFEYTVLMKVIGDDLNEIKNILNTLEIGFIKMYDSIDNGYNSCYGGISNAGYHHTKKAKRKIKKANEKRVFSDESKRKMSESAKRIYNSKKQKLINSHIGTTPWNKGVSCKSETRRKISQSHFGKHRVYNPDGTYHYEWGE